MGRSEKSSRSTTRRIAAGAALVVAALAWWLVTERRQGRHGSSEAGPNVLIITIDTLRADHLGCYGARSVSTPNIDSLAVDGLRFHRALSEVPLTLPSHASLFTGMDPLAHGVRNNGTFVLDPRRATLAEVLLENGYRTGAFVGAVPVDSRFGLNQGFQVYDDDYPGKGRQSAVFLPERPAPDVIERAVAWLGGQGRSKWFLWIHLFEPHTPYAPPAPYDSRYASDPYSGEVAFVDEVLGGFFGYLRQRDLLDRTWIILTSDHGEGLGDHHRERNHGAFTYHSTLWVPLLFRYPPTFAASTVIEERVRLIDIMPTVLDYLGIATPRGIQGESLRALIERSPGWQPPPSYFESMALTLNFDWASPRGLYLGKYKYIDLPLPELYDVDADFDETRNLVELEPDTASRMRRSLEETIQSRESEVRPRAVDRETLEGLRALGYAVSEQSGPVSRQTAFTEEDDPKRLIDILNDFDDARAAYHAGRREEAVRLYQELIEKRSDFALAYESLAHIYGELGRPAAAVEVLEAAQREKVKSETVSAMLGRYLRQAGQIDRARAVLESNLERHPEDVEARNDLGMTYYDQGRLEEAKRVFEEVLRHDPSSVSAHNNLGSIYLDQKRYDLAQAEFQTVLASDPRDAEALNGMGVAYASTGRADEAIRAWEEAVATDPNRHDTVLNLAFMLLQRNRYDEAARYMQRFVDTAPLPRYERDVREVRRILSKIRPSQ